MKNDIIELMEKLTENVGSDYFVSIAYEVTDKLEKLPNAFEAVEPIFKLMESNPNADFGDPGPLVHFMEKFDEQKYDEKLVESIRRCPTVPTLIMLRRIINGTYGSKKQRYIELFDFVINSPQVPEDEKEIAREFRSFYT